MRQSIAYATTIPSYIKGSVKQTLATLVPVRRFAPGEMAPLVLVPGAFCTASVMNRLGQALERLGRPIVVAPTFPYFLSAAANTCRIQDAAARLLRFLDALSDERGARSFDLAGHSNGGLIALLAAAIQEDAGERSRVGRIVTMATPFGGFPLARPLHLVLPFCRDLVSGCETLRRAGRMQHLVARALAADRDTLIPLTRQSLTPERTTVMRGFQHMDFIVGEEARVQATATEVNAWLSQKN